MADKDYYAILGINKNASADEIKSAYRSLAKKYHPDLYATASESEKKAAESKFKEIQHAYEVLSDPQKKASAISSVPSDVVFTEISYHFIL